MAVKVVCFGISCLCLLISIINCFCFKEGNFALKLYLLFAMLCIWVLNFSLLFV